MGIGMALPRLSERQYESNSAALIRPPQRPESRKCSGTAFPQEPFGLWKVQPGPEVGYAAFGSEGRARSVPALSRDALATSRGEKRLLPLLVCLKLVLKKSANRGA